MTLTESLGDVFPDNLKKELENAPAEEVVEEVVEQVAESPANEVPVDEPQDEEPAEHVEEKEASEKMVFKNLEIEKGETTSDTIKGFATVEEEDSDGDIIRVDGLDLSAHSEKSPLKILASHVRHIDDGTPSVIGKVTKIYKTKINGKKAVKFEMKFAKTELAKQWKLLFDEGFVDSFSIGARIYEAKEMKGKDGRFKGYDITKSKLTEISAVSIPANKSALVTKAAALIERVHEFEKAQPEQLEKEEKLINVVKSLEDSLNNLQNVFTEKINLFEDRLDEIASHLSIMPNADETEKNDETSDLEKSVDALLNKLEEFKK